MSIYGSMFAFLPQIEILNSALSGKISLWFKKMFCHSITALTIPWARQDVWGRETGRQPGQKLPLSRTCPAPNKRWVTCCHQRKDNLAVVFMIKNRADSLMDDFQWGQCLEPNVIFPSCGGHGESSTEQGQFVTLAGHSTAELGSRPISTVTVALCSDHGAHEQSCCSLLKASARKMACKRRRKQPAELRLRSLRLMVNQDKSSWWDWDRLGPGTLYWQACSCTSTNISWSNRT